MKNEKEVIEVRKKKKKKKKKHGQKIFVLFPSFCSA